MPISDFPRILHCNIFFWPPKKPKIVNSVSIFYCTNLPFSFGKPDRIFIFYSPKNWEGSILGLNAAIDFWSKMAEMMENLVEGLKLGGWYDWNTNVFTWYDFPGHQKSRAKLLWKNTFVYKIDLRFFGQLDHLSLEKHFHFDLIFSSSHKGENYFIFISQFQPTYPHHVKI